jgi:hypothetical protein
MKQKLLGISSIEQFVMILSGKFNVCTKQRGYKNERNKNVLFLTFGQGGYKEISSILLTNSALVIRVQMRGMGAVAGVSANEYSFAHHVTWSTNKLRRSISIFNLCLWVSS